MRSRAHEIEVGDLVVAIVNAEPGGLRQDWLQAERGAQMSMKILAEISRGIVKGGDDPLLQIRNEPFRDFIQNPVPEDGSYLFPVDRQLSKMGHWRQCIEGRAAWRCERGIACCRMMEVEREIGRKHSMIKDIGQ